uniref:Ankyrin repeat protein n=1 Tax=viral metagenome TaxID=1070528 RepID=A0A6C0DGT5_9ZZZZ
MKMSLRNKKKGSTNADYTPLIKAIKERDAVRVEELLTNGANPSEKDELEKWCPMKWATYVYKYSPGHNIVDNQMKMYKIVELLVEARADNCFDDGAHHDDGYNFAPLINENYHVDIEEMDVNNGGKRMRKTQRKMKSSYRKVKKSKKTTKRRKHMKK